MDINENAFLLTVELRERGGRGDIVLLEQAWCDDAEDILNEFDPETPYGAPTLNRALIKMRETAKRTAERAEGDDVFSEDEQVLRSDPRTLYRSEDFEDEKADDGVKPMAERRDFKRLEAKGHASYAALALVVALIFLGLWIAGAF